MSLPYYNAERLEQMLAEARDDCREAERRLTEANARRFRIHEALKAARRYEAERDALAAADHATARRNARPRD